MTLKDLFIKRELAFFVKEGALLNNQEGKESVTQDFERIKPCIIEWLTTKRQQEEKYNPYVTSRKIILDELLEELK